MTAMAITLATMTIVVMIPINIESTINVSLDEGTFAFMHWMNSEDKKSLTSDNPIVLVKFVNDKHTILYDTDLQSEIYIEIDNGVPHCKHCKADDCSHVGFAICVEQFYGHRRGSGREETVEDIILDN